MRAPNARRWILLAFFVLVVLYLCFWPVPVQPVAWEAPVDAGLVDPFEANDRLAAARPIDLGEHESPEDVAGGPDPFIYASTAAGRIIRFLPDGDGVEVYATVGGRPLGIEFDRDGNLFVANSMLGVQRVAPGGDVELLFEEFDGQLLVAVNDVAVAASGKIYVTESSSKFGTRDSPESYDASLLDILEHGGHGRVFEFDPASGDSRLLMRGLNYANGIAISADDRYLLVNETGHYRVWRHWLEGPKAGTSEVILDNLPGFPDNVNSGLNDRFWIGIVAPRNHLVDALSDKPFLRAVIQRLPAFVRPAAEPWSHVVAIDGDGQVLMNLQDTAARLPAVTGVYEDRGSLYLSSLFGHRVARLDKGDLASR